MSFYELPFLSKLILRLLDFFYPFFKKYLPRDLFNYLFCGSANTFLDSFLYFIIYNFVLLKQNIEFGYFTISAHIMAYIIVFPITFITGFWLSKYVTFSESNIQGKTQLKRFGVTISLTLLVQYGLLKFFVDICGFYPTPSKLVSSLFAAIITFIQHRFYTFQTNGR